MDQQMKVEQAGYELWRNYFSQGSKVPPYPRNGQQRRLVKAIVDAYGSFSVIPCMRARRDCMTITHTFHND